jgi:hypothetical protein
MGASEDRYERALRAREDAEVARLRHLWTPPDGAPDSWGPYHPHPWMIGRSGGHAGPSRRADCMGHPIVNGHPNHAHSLNRARLRAARPYPVADAWWTMYPGGGAQ